MDQVSQNQAMRFAYIKARWHADIVDQSYKGFVDTLQKEAPQAVVDVFDVPGAFEIPLKAQILAKTGKYDAIIGAAFVVDGGIYRHDFVAQAVVSGLMDVQLKTEVPVLSVSLTPHHYHNSEEHKQFFFDHFVIKGKEAADACLALVKKDSYIKQVA